MPSDKTNSYKCADCRVTISADTQEKAWEQMRAHTVAAHGRDPYINPAGEYPDDETCRKAQMGAHPEMFLIMAA